MSAPEAWEPYAATSEEVLEPGPVAALAALFDNGLPAPGEGDDLPPLWHWVALPRWPVSSRLGLDGHPVRGGFLPPVDLPRRMFAGGEVVVHRAPKVGETVRRKSIVDSVTEKSGRSGKLAIVRVRTELSGVDGTLYVEERQDMLYREAGPLAAPAVPETAAALEPVGSPFRRTDGQSWEFVTDPTLLMRFSAATANAHRIHYDWPYATRVEGYPGLVVHGPLMSLALAEVLRLDSPASRVRRISHRNQAPLFCGQPAQLRASPGARSVTLDLLGPSGLSTSLAVELSGEGS
ncbi:MaoC family dehydratase N-terminal domain-containing protein [Amycolatopsis halotolerans]|uniref:MaoC family dehydratase N-terminal domain-containing protein n=1 Tax=Amycolatopsis halotolerans TaxID=330083 RepID=A0ABV7QD92_9PSEU